MELVVGVSAAIAAVVSAIFVWSQTKEMRRQTALQREIAESAAQPYVWADFRVSADNGWSVAFVLGNSGPTIATSIRVSIDPPLPAGKRAEELIERLRPKLERGLASLAPGRQLEWPLGGSPALVNREGSIAHSIRIDYDGPFGRVEPTEFIFDFDDVRESAARHFGTLQGISKSIDELTKHLPK